MFSIYVDKLQRLVDILDKIPSVKFIVSKGPNGDKLKFPSNRFIGQNFVDQVSATSYYFPSRAGASKKTQLKSDL